MQEAPARLVVTLQERAGVYKGVAELVDTNEAPVWSIPIGPVPRDCSAVMAAMAFGVALKLDPPSPTPEAHHAARGQARNRVTGACAAPTSAPAGGRAASGRARRSPTAW